MRNSDADIAIDVLNKLIAQELEAASAGMRFGNRPLEEQDSGGVCRLHVAVEVQSGPGHLVGCLPSFRAVAPVPIGGR